VNVGHSNLFRTLSAPNEFRLPIRKFRTRHRGPPDPSTRWARPHSFRLEAVPTPSSTNRSGSACAFPQFRAHFPYLREQVKEQAPRAKAWRKTVQPLDGCRVRSGAQRLNRSQGHFCKTRLFCDRESTEKVLFPVFEKRVFAFFCPHGPKIACPRAPPRFFRRRKLFFKKT